MDMVTLKDYSAIKETLYLLRNPVNAARLTKALHDTERGKFTTHMLVDAE